MMLNIAQVRNLSISMMWLERSSLAFILWATFLHSLYIYTKKMELLTFHKM